MEQQASSSMDLSNNTNDVCVNNPPFTINSNGVYEYGTPDQRRLMIKTTNDGSYYLVPVDWIKEYPYFAMYQDIDDDEDLPLHEISYVVSNEEEKLKRVKEGSGVVGATTMNLFLQYCAYTAKHGLRKKKFKEYTPVDDIEKYATDFEKEHVITIDDDTLRNLVQDVNFIGCEDFYTFLCALIATRISNMTVEQMREYFEMPSDFTEEEWKKVEEENAWIYQ